jgi:hypothetical protein
MSRTLICTLKFPDGAQIVARARVHSPEEDVKVEWSGPLERLEAPVTLVKYAPSFLKWYLEARAQQLQAQFQFRYQDDSEPVR